MNTDYSFSEEGTSLHKERKVAVVAVHGVADQQSEDSTRAIANLLLALNPQEEGKARYTPFSESSLRFTVHPTHIAVRPTKVESPSLSSDPTQVETSQNPESSKTGRFREFWQRLGLEERGESISDYLKGKKRPTLNNLAHDYIVDQLSEYEHRAVYQTLQLEGKRRSIGGEPETKIHIYEMYWADLSRLGTGFIRIFGELYQFLFHLGSLGRHAVDLARIENQAPPERGKFNLWEYYSETQAWAGRMLSLFIPILNLYLLIASFISLPGQIPPQYLPLVSLGSIILLLTIIVGIFFWHRKDIPFRVWAALPLISILIVGGAIIAQSFLKARLSGLWNGDYRLLALEWGAVLTILIWFALIKPYSIRRPGADNLTIVLGIPLAAITILCLFTTSNSPQGISWASFRVIELIYIALYICWGAFNILYIFSLILGFFAVKSIREPAKKARAGNAARLARLSLVIPSILFLSLTLSLWMALIQVLEAWSSPDRELYTYTPLFFFKSQTPPLSYLDFARKLIVDAASPVFVALLASVLIVILLTVWSLLPAVWAEIQHPKIDEREPKKNDRERLSKPLGEWLSRGFGLMICSADYLIALVVFLFLARVAWLFLPLPTTDDLTARILGLAAGFLGATGLLAFGRRLDALTLGFRNVLDIILDVDNYLRVHPKDDNPRAQIFARYTSLLRYLCRQDYDALVIVAHSQGTVITADLLRFLGNEPDRTLKKLGTGTMPIYLFTMGCPLRQLYSFGFPHLYYWVDSWGEPTVPPLPEELGVEYWVNAFYSGDYVGRYLWDDDETVDRWDRRNVLKDKNRRWREYCLGAGAHTHYWELPKTAMETKVAEEIDCLIAKAVSKPENVTKH